MKTDEDQQVEQQPQVKQEDETLSKEEESYKKRYGDLRRHMQTKEKEWEDRFKSLEQKQSGSVPPPKSNEDLDEWIGKNPDIAGIVALLAKRQAEEILGETKSEVENLTKLRKETAKEQAELKVLEKHPDFLKIREADEFHDWVEDQPKWIQDSIYENDSEPKAIIRALDLYKIDKGMTKEDNKRKEKEAALVVKTNRKVSVEDDNSQMQFSESMIDKMSQREYEEKEEAIMAAIRSGKFLYDKSGAAR